MAIIKNYDKHLSLGYNRLKNLNNEQIKKIPVKLTTDKDENFCILVDYLQNIESEEFKLL